MSGGSIEFEIKQLLVQEDTTNDVDGKKELQWWKRIIARIDTWTKSERGRVKAILDTRSRVLRFKKIDEEGPSVDGVAEAVIFEMASFTPEPLSEILQERNEAPEGQTVWMATDSELVSGLLHQVKESGRVQARSKPPLPPALKTVLGDLLECVDNNLEIAYEWTQGRATTPFQMRFDVATWDAHQATVLRNVEDPEIRQAFVSFFRSTEANAKAVNRARSALHRQKGIAAGQPKRRSTEVDMRPFEEMARSGIQQGNHQYTQKGHSLLRSFEDYLADERREEMEYL